MAKNSIRDYDATSGNNTDVQSVDISEGCAASGINNAIREVMADLKDVSTGTVNLETPAADRLDVDNIRIDGNTISSTDTNGDITLDPNGTGDVIVASGEVGVGTTTPATYTDYVSGSNAPSVVVAGSQPSYVLADTDISGNDGTLGITKAGEDTVINNLGAGNVRISNNGAERMRIDSSGNVGIGMTPSRPLHVQASSGAASIYVRGRSSDGTATMLLHEDNSGNAQNSITGYTTHLRLDAGTTPDANHTMQFYVNDAERMRIDNSGNIYVNHSVTQYGSYVGNINISSGGLTTGFGTSNGEFRNIYSSNSGGSIILKFHSGSNVASLSTGGAWTDASDASYKRDIEDLSYGISTVKALQPRLYHLVANENDDDPQIGFVAQEIETHVPEVVVSDEDKDGSIKKGVSYGRMTAVLTKALQEAVTKIETLETEMTALKARVTALEA
jgi:hypothetical protein